MVIRGNTRGNGKQLADYLIAMNENEKVHILDVDNREYATPEYLQQMVMSMEAMASLTKSEKAFYHAQINPAYNEDKTTDWFKAAEILGEELGFEGQRRIIVLHEKKGRTHAHVVWERYDHETEIMKSDSFSRLHQDRARTRMEIEFGHAQTAKRNKHRPELKASLTQLWNQTNTGAEFVNACKNNNYMIAEGSSRDQFVVVDENGRSFNLVRQLKDVRLKDVRYRLRNETLMKEKAAIVYMINQKAEQDSDGRDKEKVKFNPPAQTIAKEFSDNGIDTASVKDSASNATNRETKFTRYQAEKEYITRQNETNAHDQVKQTIAKEFNETKQDKVLNEREQMRQALKKQREANKGKEQDRDKGMEYD